MVDQLLYPRSRLLLAKKQGRLGLQQMKVLVDVAEACLLVIGHQDAKINDYIFVRGIFSDGHFPDFIVDRKRPRPDEQAHSNPVANIM